MPFLNVSYMELVCFSKFCARVFASFSCVVLRMVLLKRALLKLDRNFFASSFKFLAGRLCRSGVIVPKASRADQRQNHG